VAVHVEQGGEPVAACNLRLTNDAWEEEITVTVKATTDLLYDGSNAANLTIDSAFKTANESHSVQRFFSEVSGVIVSSVFS
jgi:hypothetical protein